MARIAWLLAAALALPSLARAASADTEPPTISHTPVTEAAAGQVLIISATITDASGVFEPTLYYRAVGAKSYQSASMAKDAVRYTATLPPAAVTGVIEYFIEAYDRKGNGPSRFASPAAPQIIRTTSKAAGGLESSAVEQDLRESGGGRNLRIAAYSLVGAGALSLALGTYFGLSARSSESDAKSDSSAVSAVKKHAAASSAATTANVAFAAGGVLGAAGVVLALHPWTSREDRGAAAALSVGPAGATLCVVY